jgi:hypothetical protein
VVRAVSTEGWGRIRYHAHLRTRLDSDRPLRAFFERETDVLPEFYAERVRRDLGQFYAYLPEGALMHDPDAYLESQTAGVQLTALSARSAH